MNDNDRRKYASKITLGRALRDSKDAMEFANKSGNISSTIKYANTVKEIEALIEVYAEIYDEDPNLVMEGNE